MAKDIYGKALLDYQLGRSRKDPTTLLYLHGFNGPIREDFALGHLFRNFEEMPRLEQLALKHCRGRVLDIGAGAGSHSLELQRRGMDVTALDHSPGAIQTCQLRGVQKVVCSNIQAFDGIKFDTLLLLMNGIGIAGRLARLPSFLDKLKSLLNENGQIITDSSDLCYMYQQDEDCSFQIPAEGPYYGEGSFILEYQGKKSDAFPWLYVDFRKLKAAASQSGLNCELLAEGDHYDYLACIKTK